MWDKKKRIKYAEVILRGLTRDQLPAFQQWKLFFSQLEKLGHHLVPLFLFTYLSYSRIFISLSVRRHSSSRQWGACWPPQTGLLLCGKYRLDCHRTPKAPNFCISFWPFLMTPLLLLLNCCSSCYFKKKSIAGKFCEGPSQILFLVLSLLCEPLSDQTPLQWFWAYKGTQGGAAHLAAQTKWIWHRNRAAGA